MCVPLMAVTRASLPWRATGCCPLRPRLGMPGAPLVTLEPHAPPTLATPRSPQFVRMLHILEDYFELRKDRFGPGAALSYHGELTMEEKDHAVVTFQAPGSKAFALLASTKVGPCFVRPPFTCAAPMTTSCAGLRGANVRDCVHRAYRSDC